ncbi:MAG: DUF1972 domain-containing protein [Burkholderiaceae bacterium]|nr:DUF1972 domain-containing protein [Burkholderiaceae bacterium]MEB2350082.1 DUF1972 domain-containing protein [Burkholderiaceae bacterium]
MPETTNSSVQSHSPAPVLRILGIRGVPAAHGGFETFAENLSLYLVARGWRVLVYCQEEGGGPITTDSWRGVDRVRVPVRGHGAASTVLFDWICTRHAARHSDLCLTLGYNTAAFSALLKARGVPSLINMDGIEWRRSKWSLPARWWFRVNDWLGCWLADQLIADNPGIADLLARRTARERIEMIPYGAPQLVDVPPEPLRAFGLEPECYFTVIARPEPENAILEIVAAFSRRPRGCRLVVVGDYDPRVSYHARVMRAAGPEVVFLGAQYDRALLDALRYHCLGYLHGHQVGGTNPSLVEAMGAGNAVIAHDNSYNRWVAGEGALYFRSPDEADWAITRLIAYPGLRRQLAQINRSRAAETFSWERVLQAYRSLLIRHLPRSAVARPQGAAGTLDESLHADSAGGV